MDHCRFHALNGVDDTRSGVDARSHFSRLFAVTAYTCLAQKSRRVPQRDNVLAPSFNIVKSSLKCRNYLASGGASREVPSRPGVGYGLAVSPLADPFVAI